MGEPAGIGGEITLKAWRTREASGLPPYFVVDDAARLQRIATQLEWDIPVVEIEKPEDAVDTFGDALPVIPLEVPAVVVPGCPQPETSAAVVSSIERAVGYVTGGQAMAIVTNPIQKKALYDCGFQYPGHTEFLATFADGDAQPVMMLACEQLRVVPMTVHQPLREAIASLRSANIVKTVWTTVRALRRDFAIDRPHVMIAALNPHAGEEGAMGREEIEIIAPAVEELKKAGCSVTGPTPADTMFHDRARTAYDAAVCMYHDQALIPLKTIDFSSGVNITLGLPFVRTSPDHGTALEIAGRGVADESSLVAALKIAARTAGNRTRSRLISDDRSSNRPN
tara:strand:- start:283 stop:1299 length:1017 start_codon:yes stop_codon:yes gene_type:complete